MIRHSIKSFLKVCIYLRVVKSVQTHIVMKGASTSTNYIELYNWQTLKEHVLKKMRRIAPQNPIFFSGSPPSDRNSAKDVYWIGLHAYILFFYYFTISKVGHFSCQLKWPNLFFKRVSCQTQGCFIYLKMAFHGHLQWRNYCEKFAAIRHDNFFDGDKMVAWVVWLLVTFSQIYTLLSVGFYIQDCILPCL